MIVTFKCLSTQELWTTGKSRRLPSDLHRAALRKLWQLDTAQHLKDLSAPRDNRLEPLKNDCQDQFSIHINDHWRICFIWQDDQVYEVEIINYH